MMLSLKGYFIESFPFLFQELALSLHPQFKNKV